MLFEKMRVDVLFGKIGWFMAGAGQRRRQHGWCSRTEGSTTTAVCDVRHNRQHRKCGVFAASSGLGRLASMWSGCRNFRHQFSEFRYMCGQEEWRRWLIWGMGWSDDIVNMKRGARRTTWGWGGVITLVIRAEGHAGPLSTSLGHFASWATASGCTLLASRWLLQPWPPLLLERSLPLKSLTAHAQLLGQLRRRENGLQTDKNPSTCVYV